MKMSSIRKLFLAGLLFLCVMNLSAWDIKLLVPKKIYAVPGIEANVYFNNIVTVINPANYVFDVDCKKGRNDLKRWRFIPEDGDVGTYEWKITVIDQNGVVAEAESELVVVPRNAGEGRKLSMLMVGDSLTGAGHYPARVAELMARPGNPEFKPVGTKIRELGRHEGYGGWRWHTFFTRYGYSGSSKMDGMHPDRPVGVNSPFMFPVDDNGKKWEFNLKKYLEKNNDGKVPDIVSFQLGINEFFSATDSNIANITKNSLVNMQKLISEFLKLEPVPKIFVFQNVPCSNQDGFGKNYGCWQTSWQYRKNLDYYNRALQEKCRHMNIDVVPMYINIDAENNYPAVSEAVNYGNPEQIVRQNNGVHPARTGYRQMGDTLYCFIKAWLHENPSEKQ